ncbi:hypothetical protein [Spirosoma validum]|uniref:Uncharacterized protein n=1 Tax=Spirosoma validum TaxID=2771355 RepID=A0A927GEL5_9BACT|nr:hypothetical protein [Spirosoma validum]MBD2754957.1 hypothetical protein [Spirosoma validum]
MARKYTSLLVVLIGYCQFVWAQSPPLRTKSSEVDTVFLPIIQYFANTRRELRDTTTYPLPTLYESQYYTLKLAHSALHWSKHKRSVHNPFGDDKYPLSYSVLYKGCLVSLFSPGFFACYNSANWTRNKVLEKQLNAKRFHYHWLINGQLIGLSGGRYWVFTDQIGWTLYLNPVPFGKQPKLFEDSKYLAYSNCKGEFGGTIFFYEKQSRKIHSTQAVCANWVYHTQDGYHVLSNLGHMIGSADEQVIQDPGRLPSPEPKNAKPGAPDLTVTKLQFDLTGIQLFGGFLLQNKAVYLTLVGNGTCLATLSGKTFTIIDPLFDSEIYTHNPVSTTYGEITVINLDFYGLGREHEVQCLVIRNGHVELIQWI